MMFPNIGPPVYVAVDEEHDDDYDARRRPWDLSLFVQVLGCGFSL